MRVINKFNSVLLFAVIMLFALAACGGEDGSSDGDENTDGDEQEGCGTADMLEGSWTSTAITLDIDSDLNYHAVGVNDTGYDVNGSIFVDGCSVELTETEGTLACPEEQVGRYSFVVTDSTLVFTLEADDCQGRAMGIDGKTFTRN